MLKEHFEPDAQFTRIGILFYGRCDKILVTDNRCSKFYRSIEKEQHITILSETGNEYFTHFTPKTGTAEPIANLIWESIKNVSKDVFVIGCTNVNTGKCGGIISHL